MSTYIALYLFDENLKEAEITPREAETGERYWVIRLPTSTSIYIDNSDLRTLIEKISEALEEGGRQSESATYQCSVGVPGSPVSGEGSTGST